MLLRNSVDGMRGKHWRPPYLDGPEGHELTGLYR
jgi:hypothetical protein